MITPTYLASIIIPQDHISRIAVLLNQCNHQRHHQHHRGHQNRQHELHRHYAVNRQSDTALSNAVGSNSFNLLFILGLSALITPSVVSQQLVRLDVPLMIGASILIAFFAFDGHLVLWEGAILFLSIVIYTVF